MKCLLVYLVAGERAHGAAAYTAHLAKALRSRGYDPAIVRIAKRPRGREAFGMGEAMFTETLDTVLGYVRAGVPAFLTVSHFKDYPEETTALLRAGVTTPIHATAELKKRPRFVEEAIRSKLVFPAVRPSLATFAASMGLRSVYVPHPYVPRGHDGRLRHEHALAMSRIDYAKHTEIVAAANERLPEGKRIAIYGTLNRMFAFHTLDVEHDGWRAMWRGPFTIDDGLNLARSAWMAVDMTHWKGDGGGGTQYTFLEAWDAGTHLVLHERWRGDGTATTDGACTYVDGADALRDVILAGPDGDVIARGAKALRGHTPDVMVPVLEEVLRWK